MSTRSLYAWTVAAESFELAVAPRVRPTPLRWLRYAYFGRLPARHSVWVLYDTTCSTWVARYLARTLVAAVLPVAALLLLLPAPLPVRILTASAIGGGALLFTAIWINEITEHRLIQAGYRWSLGAQLRAKRDEVAHWLQVW